MRALLGMLLLWLCVATAYAALQLPASSVPVSSEKNTIAGAPQALSELRAQPGTCVVRLESGQLTIKADRCTLAEVLNAISAATGAVVDWQGEDDGEKMGVQGGPGNPAQVLNSVLYGLGWEHYIKTKADGSIESITLTSKLKPHPDPESPPVENNGGECPTAGGENSSSGASSNKDCTTTIARKNETGSGPGADGTKSPEDGELAPHAANPPSEEIVKDLLPLWPSLFPESARPAEPADPAPRPMVSQMKDANGNIMPPGNISPEVWAALVQLYGPDVVKKLQSGPVAPVLPQPKPASGTGVSILRRGH